jgi:hypothetical protein
MPNKGWKILIILLFLVIIICVMALTGCHAKNEVTTAVTEQSSQSVNMTPDVSEPLDERYKENPELLMADVYAGHYVVTSEEALRRFDIADAIGGLGSELETAEPETFAGLWIQHEPTFCIVIAFTRDGEAAVEKYVTEDIKDYVEVRTLKYSYSELKKVQGEVITSLRDLNIPFGGGIDIINNRVDIDVTDRTEIDNAIKDGRLIIPECVQINIVEGLPVPC